ncbi:MAG: hypothetical protein QOE13_1046 [Gaiellaceae bacterium]|nr:hypothetical protein [Gaiellaceae bacterium]
MSWAGQPLRHDPLSSDAGSPREVLAEDGTPSTLREGPVRNRAVREVLTSHHVRGVPPRGAEQMNVHPQRGKPMA